MQISSDSLLGMYVVLSDQEDMYQCRYSQHMLLALWSLQVPRDH